MKSQLVKYIVLSLNTKSVMLISPIYLRICVFLLHIHDSTFNFTCYMYIYNISLYMWYVTWWWFSLELCPAEASSRPQAYILFDFVFLYVALSIILILRNLCVTKGVITYLVSHTGAPRVPEISRTLIQPLCPSKCTVLVVLEICY